MQLKTLPTTDLDLFVQDAPKAEFVIKNRRPVTPNDLVEGRGELEWDGPLDGVIIVGYPYISKVAQFDSDGSEVSRLPNLPDLGYPLHILFWSEEHHGFACVRKDVYNV